MTTARTRGTLCGAPNPAGVADVPDHLTLRHHRDLEGRERRPLTRWILLALLALFCLLGLANVFGQRPDTELVDGPVASLKLYTPDRLRSGLYYESRFTITAHQDIQNATLVLDPGWLEGITLNTIEPSPVSEASRNGQIALELGHVPAGSIYRLFLQSQVNPTNVGIRSQDVTLADGEKPLLHIERTITIFP
jgi:hypothetical protein